MKYYDENHVLDKLKEFAMKSFQGSKRTVPPKLKGNAASVRIAKRSHAGILPPSTMGAVEAVKPPPPPEKAALTDVSCRP